MTVIDKILFRFKMTDEQFARELYADWDGFFRNCVTEVLEEYFFGYDNKDIYIEIDRLELDLGRMPQEDFYDLFPVRLREALERSFLHRLNEADALQASYSESPGAEASTGTDKSSSYAREKRFDNLIHYLEYGFCLPEWDTREFDLYEELLYFKDKGKTEQLLSLLVSKPYVLGRLFLQTDAERWTDIIPFATWVVSTAIGQYEKQRYLSVLLERVPQEIIRYIHETKDTGSIEGMAELLENPHVKYIMATETESHAEIDVPEYWYRLYDWLLEYYPFNGVPMFGDKRHFRLHLNRRLLSFIQKRDYQAYLSKTELTIQFLLEVFGADYYLTVLNIIYRNQRLNADGSPATGDSYAWELYYMLLQLSLIKALNMTTCHSERLTENSSDDNDLKATTETDGYSGCEVELEEHLHSGHIGSETELAERQCKSGTPNEIQRNKESVMFSGKSLHPVPLSDKGPYSISAPISVFIEHVSTFGQWLEDTELPDSIKRTVLSRLVKEKPELLVQWLKNRPEKRHLPQFTVLIDKPEVLLLVGHFSLQLAETISVLLDMLDKISASVSWLKDIDRNKLRTALSIAVLNGISANIFSASDSVAVQLLRIAGLLYKIITGKEAAITVTSSEVVSYTAGPKDISADHYWPTENITGPATKGSTDNVVSNDTVTIGGVEVPVSLQEFVKVVADGINSLAIDDDKIPNVQMHKYRPDGTLTERQQILALQTVLSDRDIPEEAKKMLILQWFDVYHGKESRLVSALQSNGLLERVISLLGVSTLRHIVMRLAGQVSATGRPNNGSTSVQLVNLLVENIEAVAGKISRPARAVWLPLFVSLASWNSGSAAISTVNNTEFVIRLLAAIAGSNRVKVVIQSLIRYLVYDSYVAASDDKNFDTAKLIFEAENNALLSLLVRAQEYIHSGKQSGIHSAAENGKEAVAETNEIHTNSGNRDLPVPTDTDDLNEVRTAFEQHLNDIAGIFAWLRNEAFTYVQKRAVFFRYAVDNPDEVVYLVRETVTSEDSTVALWADIVDKNMALNLIRHTDNGLPVILSQVIGAITTISVGATLFTGSSAEWDMSITKALLLLIAKKSDLGNIDAGEITHLFLTYLHYIVTGNEEYMDTDRKQWESLERQIVEFETLAEITDTEVVSATGNGILSLAYLPTDGDERIFDGLVTWLMTPSVSNTVKSQMLRHYARWQPKQLWEFARYSTTDGSGKKSISFGQWSVWLGIETWLEIISGVSFFLGETLRQTAGVVSEKYGLDESILSEGLVQFIADYPTDRIYYGDSSLIVRKYIEKITSFIWKDGIPDIVREQTIIITGNQSEYEEADKTSFPDEQLSLLDAITKEVETELHITDTERTLENAVQPEYIEVSNAGLCLLAVWLPRLFDMLGLLTINADGKKDLKDTDARIRAIFILQRLVTDEKREYKEHEQAFNRILTGCPFHVPLPKTLELTGHEIQTVESMLAGVKANWTKLKNTSVKGFQYSFIKRPGKLEQREDKWVLYVENRAYDILLDSLPWSYRQIWFPWLKKKINVVWRDKEEFNFENYNN